LSDASTRFGRNHIISIQNSWRKSGARIAIGPSVAGRVSELWVAVFIPRTLGLARTVDPPVQKLKDAPIAGDLSLNAFHGAIVFNPAGGSAR
jgi:hypothetical protein